MSARKRAARKKRPDNGKGAGVLAPFCFNEINSAKAHRLRQPDIALIKIAVTAAHGGSSWIERTTVGFQL